MENAPGPVTATRTDSRGSPRSAVSAVLSSSTCWAASAPCRSPGPGRPARPRPRQPRRGPRRPRRPPPSARRGRETRGRPAVRREPSPPRRGPASRPARCSWPSSVTSVSVGGASRPVANAVLAEKRPIAVGAILQQRLLAVTVGVIAEQGVELVLEATRVDGAVDAALLRRVGLPPPPPGSVGLAQLDGAGAWGATDGRESLVVQGVVGDLVHPDVVPDLFFRPVRQWIHLDDATVVVVQLQLADVGAGGPLLAPDTRDPRVHAAQVSVQWEDLSAPATEETKGHARVHQVRAVALNHLLDLGGIGDLDLDRDPVALPDSLH